MCDVAHVLLIEQMERQVYADRQIAALQAVMSGKGGDLPSVFDARNQFEAALVADPVPSHVDDELLRLRRALGVL